MNDQELLIAGRKLAAVIRDNPSDTLSTSWIQAVIRDIIPGREPVLEALLSIAARPLFHRFCKRVGTSATAPELDSLRSELSVIYSSRITIELMIFLAGMHEHSSQNYESTSADTGLSDPSFSEENLLRQPSIDGKKHASIPFSRTDGLHPSPEPVHKSVAPQSSDGDLSTSRSGTQKATGTLAKMTNHRNRAKSTLSKPDRAVLFILFFWSMFLFERLVHFATTPGINASWSGGSCVFVGPGANDYKCSSESLK